MMTVHVLHAGDGYSYLTRQVATHDVSREQGKSLSDYYMQHGNPPGQWVGRGLDALGVVGTVREDQMRALFGEGLHPEADRLTAAAIAAGRTEEQAVAEVRLGRRFSRFEREDDTFNARVAEAFATFRATHDRNPEVGIERDLIRWTVAGEVLTEQRGGEAPSDADRARFLATRGQAARQPVAGYDLVFTPVKSVSTLWALGDAQVREQVAEAHRAAWTEALEWVQSEGAFTRAGRAGVAQIDTHGLIATAFDHLDSRTGDPNLHTHVAVSNKVLGVDGKWRALDGRVLHALGVAASERYNTNVETELRERLGVEFVEETRRAGRQGVREVAGIDRGVREAFSRRRASIEDEYERLLGEYRAKHGHEAPRGMQFRLAQQATLETRGEKGAVVSLGARIAEWQTVAARILGSPSEVSRMVRSALNRDVGEARVVEVDELAQEVVQNLTTKRATWGRFHLEAEALRVARENVARGQDVRSLVRDVVARATSLSIALTPPELNETPEVLRRADGESVYTVHGSERFTSLAVLEAEDALVAAAQSDGGLRVDEGTFERATSEIEESTGRRLNAGQRELARRFAVGGHRIEAGIGPAGAGKTTAMKAFTHAVETAGGRVLALAPSAAAAAVLGGEIGTAADTLHKLLDAHRDDRPTPADLVVDERTVLLVDEAGMAGTTELAAVLELAVRRGASVRLLGDPAQLSAVGAGGALRLLDERAGAAHLEEVHRFTDAAEAAASLRLRDGDVGAVGFYVDNRRVAGGSQQDMTDDLYTAWWADNEAGLTSVMVAATNTDVVTLASRARLDRVAAGEVERDGVELHDGTRAGAGDVVVTRSNDRRLKAGPTDYVKNGDLWHVTGRSRRGHLRVQHTTTGARTTLPADYVREHVELGYAATIHRVQGMTVDTSHTLVGAGMTREQMYTAVTRGRRSNRLYVVAEELLEVDAHEQPAPERAAAAALESVVARSGAELSATETVEHEYDAAESLARLVPAYEDAYERLLDPDRDERLSAAARAALPERADELLADPAWPALAARVALHEAAGADPVEVLRGAAEERTLAGAKSLAQVLHHRVGVPTLHDLDRRGLPAWITPAPDVVLPDVGAQEAPVDAERARALEVQAAAWTWWQDQRSRTPWADEYMATRGLAATEYGVAPAGWTALVEHLAAAGYSDDDMLAAGVATTTRRGTLVDRFRDRVVFPVRDEHGDVVGVSARINPASTDERAPKYLNTPETVTYRKRELLLGLDPEARARLVAGARPVLVEGAADRAAILAAAPDVVPVAACGTGVTEEHLAALRAAAGRELHDLVVALDPDAAGRKAAAKVWTMLTPAEAASAAALDLPAGLDPAQMVQDHRGDELRAALEHPNRSLTSAVIDATIDRHDLTYPEGRAVAMRDAAHTTAAHLEPAALAGVAAHLAARFADHYPRELVEEEVTEAWLERRPQPGPAAPAAAVPARSIDPQVAAWLNRQADMVARRLDRLVDDVAARRTPWAGAIADAPATTAARDQWETAVRHIAAYRDRYAITSSEPLGRADVVGEQALARQHAAAALDTVARAEDEPALAVAPSRTLDRAQQILADARARREAAQREAAAREETQRRQREEQARDQHGRGRGFER
ncbi:MobF family relaxase [Cellulosimicrobium sp. 22601]|uniref:MobF family relaxase n=1 Tax=unclassified Cellulosimicrobium TaxID=2624466 RepID=UPI003F8364AC